MSSPASSRAAIALAAVVIVALGLQVAGGVVLPVLTAIVITVVSAPILGALERAGIPHGGAATLTLLLDVAVLVGIVALGASSVEGLEEAIPRYADRIDVLVDQAQRSLRSLGISSRASSVDRLLEGEEMRGVVAATLAAGAEIASNVLLVVLLVAFMVFELRSFERKLAILMGSNEGLERVADAARRIQRYLFVKTGISLLVGVLVWAGLAAIGVDFPLLWGLVTFLFNYVPSIGPLLAMVPSTLVALLSLGPGGAAMALLVQTIVHLVIGNAVEPRVMGEALGISTVVVVVSMLFWGWLWGPVGALFAVPLTRLLISVLELTPETRWLALLLGSHDWAEAKGRAWGWTSGPGDRPSGIITPGPAPHTEAPPPDAAVAGTSEDASGPTVAPPIGPGRSSDAAE